MSTRTEGLARLQAWLKGTPSSGKALELARCLTLLDLLFRPIGPWWIRPFILAIAGVAILRPAWRRSPATWFGLALLTGWRVAHEWPLADNHAWLLSYWCLALALSAGASEPGATLRRTGRLLIGLAFLFATLWKAFLAPDYLDGRFFRVTLLTDERFANVAMLVGDMDRDALEESRDYLRPLPGGIERSQVIDGPRLRETKRLRAFAWLLTWVTVLYEGLIALVFLFPLSRRTEPIAHLTLLLFCAGTYALAPVVGFAWLLLSMGVAGCREDQRRLRAAYMVVFALMLFYKYVPWSDLAIEWREAPRLEALASAAQIPEAPSHSG